jgi:CubicO group peptidase (beta-lactamase class C family)
MKKLIVLLLTVTAASVIIYSSSPSNSNMENTNTFLQQQVTKHNTPSIYYTFFDMDSIIYQSSFGCGNVKEATPVNSNSTYHIFSITKTFTALAVLQLVEQKKIELNEKVTKYLPGFLYGNEVTVEQLLTHTAGLPNPLPLNWIHLAEEDKTFHQNDFFSKIFNHHNQLKSKPDSKFAYSNLGYVILGELVKSVSGKTYEEYVNENIVHKLGLESRELGFKINSPGHVSGYQKYFSFTNLILGAFLNKKKYMGEAEGKWKPFKPFYINGTSYGGLISTPNALVKYGQSLLNNHSTLINEESKRLLFSEKRIDGKKTGMCYSWFTGSLKGNQYYHHAGGGGGYYVELRLYPKLGVGSAIFFNRTGMTNERILDKTDAFFISVNNSLN